MPTYNLSQLAEELSAHAKVLQDHLEASNHAGLSLDANAPIVVPLDPSNIEVQGAKEALVRISKLMHDLTSGPRELLMELTTNVKFDLMTLHTIVHFGIADAIPRNEHVSFDAVAKAVGLSTDRVRRILRHAMTNNMFHEPRPGYVGHSGLSSIIIRQPTSKSWILHNLEDVPTSKFIPALKKWGDSLEPTETGCQLAFDYLASHPTESWWTFLENDGDGEGRGYRMQRFAEAMSWVSGGMNDNYDYLLKGFNWGSLGEATVVDVGGSTGHCSIAIAQQFPSLNFVVEDFPSLQTNFERRLPAELTNRITFRPHDIFTPQPVNAAVYFLRLILHDYSDPYAVKILQNLVPAMKTGSRIVISEIMLPSPGTPSSPMLRMMHTCDLQMMAVLNSKERNYEDWVEIGRAHV